MRRIAARLGFDVPEDRWPALVDAATFAQMRARADQAAPDPSGILRDRAAFFRRGTSGSGRATLTGEELTRYRARTAAMAPPEMLAWLHRDGDASDPPAGVAPAMIDPAGLVFPDAFETERLLVRRPRPGDGPELYAAITESLPELAPWMPWAHEPQSPLSCENNVLGAYADFLARRDLRLQLYLRAAPETLVGSSGLHRIDWTRAPVRDRLLAADPVRGPGIRRRRRSAASRRSRSGSWAPNGSRSGATNATSGVRRWPAVSASATRRRCGIGIAGWTGRW